jgi:SAM-dependent methyltransferase
LAETGGYEARTAYLNPALVTEYERDRFSGHLGRYRWGREQQAVTEMIDRAWQARRVLDIPCGVGRWVPVLRRLQPEVIVQADISPAMLTASRERWSGSFPLARVDATALPFADGTFDLVFSHALTKHLPLALQARVLAELGRVSSRYVVCSFSIDAGLPGLARRLRGAGLSIGVSRAWLDRAAGSAGLRVVAARSCTTPIGLESSVLLARVA